MPSHAGGRRLDVGETVVIEYSIDGGASNVGISHGFPGTNPAWPATQPRSFASGRRGTERRDHAHIDNADASFNVPANASVQIVRTVNLTGATTRCSDLPGSAAAWTPQ